MKTTTSLFFGLLALACLSYCEALPATEVQTRNSHVAERSPRNLGLLITIVTKLTVIIVSTKKIDFILIMKARLQFLSSTFASTLTDFIAKMLCHLNDKLYVV